MCVFSVSVEELEVLSPTARGEKFRGRKRFCGERQNAKSSVRNFRFARRL
jgi:hypothetical protein